MLAPTVDAMAALGPSETASSSEDGSLAAASAAQPPRPAKRRLVLVAGEPKKRMANLLTLLLNNKDTPWVRAFADACGLDIADGPRLATSMAKPEARAALAPLVDGVDGGGGGGGAGGGGGQGGGRKKKRRGKGGMAHYAPGEAALVEQAIEQTLAVDARSAHKSAKAKEAVQALRFDSLLVKFTWVAGSEGGGVATHGADEVRVLSVERDDDVIT